MQKKNIAVLFGGVSNEYEVSLRSVCSVLRSIDRAVYQPLPIGITRQGKWFYYPARRSISRPMTGMSSPAVSALSFRPTDA